MGCCGQHRSAGKPSALQPGQPERERVPPIYPATQCELCAQKHLAHADCIRRAQIQLALAHALKYEPGYEQINHMRIIGELSACALHLYKDHPELAGKVRAVRHLVQERKDSEAEWEPLLIEMDAVATKELTNRPA